MPREWDEGSPAMSETNCMKGLDSCRAVRQGVLIDVGVGSPRPQGDSSNWDAMQVEDDCRFVLLGDNVEDDGMGVSDVINRETVCSTIRCVELVLRDKVGEACWGMDPVLTSGVEPWSDPAIDEMDNVGRIVVPCSVVAVVE